MTACDDCKISNANAYEYDIDEIAMTVTNYYCDECANKHMQQSINHVVILVVISIGIISSLLLHSYFFG
jgi:hypothetical protein